MANKDKEELLDLNLSDIVLAENTRRHYPAEEMGELMQSIKKNGQLQPVGVKSSATSPGKYDLIFGFRRYFAVKKLGYKSIKAIPQLMAEEDEKSAYIMNAIENMQRADVPVAEQGRIFSKLQKEGMDIAEIAARVGVPPARVRTYIEMHDKIPANFRNKITQGKHRGGLVKKRGHIPATIATFVMNLQDKHELNDDQLEKLMKAAQEDGFTNAHLNVVNTLLDEGQPFHKALDTAEKCQTVTVTVAIPRTDIRRIEKERNGRDIKSILMDILAAKKDMNVIVPKAKLIIRKKESA